APARQPRRHRAGGGGQGGYPHRHRVRSRRRLQPRGRPARRRDRASLLPPHAVGGRDRDHHTFVGGRSYNFSVPHRLSRKGAPMTRYSLLTPLVVALALAAGCAGQPELWKNLGTYSHPITTISPRSQAYFDQGLRLTYGFNHAEAQRSFREAARVDPSCAMCQWGIAITYGSNYNDPTNPDREQGALAAAQKAQALA